MAIDKRAENAGEELKGRAKEAAGAVSDDEQLRSEGRGEQLGAKAKQAAEDVKERARDTIEDVKKKLG